MTAGRADRLRAFVPLLLPILLLLPLFPIVLALAAGIAITVALSRIDGVVRVARSRVTIIAGRIAIGVATVALLASALIDLYDVIVRDDATSARATLPARSLGITLVGDT